MKTTFVILFFLVSLITVSAQFILDVKTVEEADELVQTDPAVKAKLLDVELFPWYGSAALAEYLPASDKIWKVQP